MGKTAPRAPLEATATEPETEAVDAEKPETEIAAPEIAQIPMAPPEPPLPTLSEMTGGELAEIKTRNDAVDRAQKAAQTAQDEAWHLARIAQYAQEALSTGLSNMINERIGRGLLDQNQQYRIDIERGRIIAVPRQRQG